MNGEDIGKLRVLLQTANGTDDPTLLKQWSGHQDDKWLKSGITIQPQTEDYQVKLGITLLNPHCPTCSYLLPLYRKLPQSVPAGPPWSSMLIENLVDEIAICQWPRCVV